jgi:gamma-glutamylputrescine oxidase
MPASVPPAVPSAPADFFPRDPDGFPFANYVLAGEAARPSFGPPVQRAAGSEQDPVILVIGAGYTGVSAALRLAELQQASGLRARIMLVEAGRVASGPSGKSAGHICGLQAPDDAVRRHCGTELAERLIAAATDAADLVRVLVARHEIPCDLRDGYIAIDRNNRQRTVEGGDEFGIDPYPFVLGLARAARDRGVEIHENTKIIGLDDGPDGCLATTADGATIRATLVLAAGGHRMAENIPLLAPLRSRTTELRVSTIITDPLPDSVLRSVMPDADGRRYPFSTDTANVAYGSIDRRNRIVFGACATACTDPAPDQIARTLEAILPSLADNYRAAAAKPLGWRPLVTAERLCYTRDRLPNVGTAAGHRRVHYVQALGGHGVALGTLLGTAAAEKLWGIHSGNPAMGAVFDLFAAINHRWLPPRQPWRGAVASIGLFLR